MRIRIPLAVSLLLLSGSLAQAQPVTFHFTATIYTSTGAAPISSGTVTGSYTFDAGWPYGPSGTYTWIGPPYGFAIEIDGAEYVNTDGLLIAVYDAAWDQYTVFSAISAFTPSAGSWAIRYVSIDLWGPNTIFSGADLPLTPPDLSLFPTGNQLGVSFMDTTGTYIGTAYGHVTSLTLANSPPVAEAGPDHVVLVNESVYLDSSGSSDADGEIASSSWDFGDDTTATGAVAIHTYSQPGQFTVTLTVTDDDGATGTDTATVTVQTASQGISTLSTRVATYNIGQGITNSLDAKLQNVIAALAAANSGQRQDAINRLQAFVSAVEAQRGKELTDAQANELVALATRIIAVM